MVVARGGVTTANVHGPRANWKGFLRLSLVTCRVAPYPATSEAEKISFNQVNKNAERS
jgi:DNA end-binding protein Ku